MFWHDFSLGAVVLIYLIIKSLKYLRAVLTFDEETVKNNVFHVSMSMISILLLGTRRPTRIRMGHGMDGFGINGMPSIGIR